MLIRRMTKADIEQAVQIETACFSQPWSAQSFSDSISRQDTLFLVCEMTDADSMGKIAGYIGMYQSFEEGSITNVAVIPEYRKQGIGNLLVQNMKEQARSASVETIFLEVRISNIPAISLYEKMGFEKLGIRKNFYEHPTEDAYIMSCKLKDIN